MKETKKIRSYLNFILHSCVLNFHFILACFHFILTCFNISAIVTFGNSKLAEISFMVFLIPSIHLGLTPFISTHDGRESTLIDMSLKIFKPDNVRTVTILVVTLDFQIF
jgi:hypothetical protein